MLSIYKDIKKREREEEEKRGIREGRGEGRGEGGERKEKRGAKVHQVPNSEQWLLLSLP